jgi:hypothetical protein
MNAETDRANSLFEPHPIRLVARIALYGRDYVPLGFSRRSPLGCTMLAYG